MKLGSLALGLAFVAIGCDDNHTGQPKDPTGPVQLVRIMVQDSQPFGVRGVAMDLLDTPGSANSLAVACSDVDPCSPQFVLAGTNPDFSCTSAGTCNDPLAAGLAPLTPPESGAPGEAGGTQIRLVFNKLLPASSKAADVVELDDASGNKVAADAFFDPTGSATTTSDPIRAPYGPALVLKPSAPLDAHAQYTIKVNGALVTDRSGNPMADPAGAVVSGVFTKAFTTENLELLAATTVTDVTAAGVSIKPDEILQLGFNARFAASTSCTATRGGATVPVKAYAEAGADAAACADATDATLLDIVAVDALGAPTDWAAGSYEVSCTVAANGGGGTTTVAGTFTVAGTAAASDPQSRTQHVVCAP